ncbi:MAG: SAM-dependent methyltransferase [Ruminococcus sp.]|nr:SAM-dependent methyltransferase [Ruminococcus sp.]
MSFLIEYIKHPRTIGAVAPSGNHLAEKMIEPIDFKSAEVIVEYGSGTGSFTKELVVHRKPETVLILIEQNKNFCHELKKTFCNQPNIHVINGSAENVNLYLKKCGFKHADYIVSGLPFTSLPAEVSENILESTRKAIGSKGRFITFQYSLVKRKFFERYFHVSGLLHEFINLPPAYVLVMRNIRESEIK